MRPETQTEKQTLKEALRVWLDARQQMMVAFNDLCLLKPFDKQNKEDVQFCLENFCNELIDYLSYAQFRVFDQLFDVFHPNSQEGQHIKKLLGKIFSTTVESIEFHDTVMKNLLMKSLETQISQIGVHLASRLEWEDQLLEVIHEHLSTLKPKY